MYSHSACGHWFLQSLVQTLQLSCQLLRLALEVKGVMFSMDLNEYLSWLRGFPAGCEVRGKTCSKIRPFLSLGVRCCFQRALPMVCDLYQVLRRWWRWQELNVLPPPPQGSSECLFHTPLTVSSTNTPSCGQWPHGVKPFLWLSLNEITKLNKLLRSNHLDVPPMTDKSAFSLICKTVRNPPRALRGLEKNLVHFCSFQRTQHSTLYTHEISQGWLNQIIELEKMHSYEGHFNEKLLFKRSEVLAPSRSLC